MSYQTEYTECGAPHPRYPDVTCTQPVRHLFEHVSFDYPHAGQWEAGA